MQSEIKYDLRTFQKVALQPGGKPRELALRDASDAVAALSGAARNLIRTNIEQLTFLGPCLQTGNSMEQAYRKAVEIAEVSSFHGWATISDVAQSLSELIFRMAATGSVETESFVVHVQSLKLACAAGDNGMEHLTASVLISRLGKVVGQIPDPDRALREATG